MRRTLCDRCDTFDIYIPVLSTQSAASSCNFPDVELFSSIERILHRNWMHLVLMQLIEFHVKVCGLIPKQDEVVCIQILNM